MKKIFLATLLSVISLFAYEQLTEKNFDSSLKDKNAIVDFYAPWCPPCKILATNLEDFEVKKPDNVTVYKVNIDEQMALAEKYGVTKLPTVILFKNGKAIKGTIGILTSEELLQISKDNFK